MNHRKTKVHQPEDQIQQQIENLSPWFHNIHLPGGIQTAPDHYLGDFPQYKWNIVSRYLPESLKGWNVLDIGCNAGFYSIKLAERGARVTAIDVDARYLRQASWAAEQFGVRDRIVFQEMQVYDLAWSKRTYDLVMFLGVLYHLRYPLLALDIVCRKVGKLMIFQTMTMAGKQKVRTPDDLAIEEREPLSGEGWPKAAFIENSFAGDPTNWWIFNDAGAQALLRSAGMEIVDIPGQELYVCKPDLTGIAWQITRSSSEFFTARTAFQAHRRRMRKGELGKNRA